MKMAFPTLSIRNLTSHVTELKLVERYESPRSLEDKNTIGNITRSFTNLMSNFTTSAAPTSPQLATKSGSFTNQDVSISIAPFDVKITEIQRKLNEVLRLTFETEGQRYRLDIPTSSQKSTLLTSLSSSPRFEYTAIYLPNYSYLALYSSAKLDSWMSKLGDETPLSGLSIPGTHNSPTCHVALPSVRCQAVGVPEQLKNGVRFLDIRIQPESSQEPLKDGLILVHSAFPISLTGNKWFRDLLNDVTSFLDKSPSETVIMSIKREGTGKASDQQLSRILHDHYTTDADRWFTEPRIPTLGEARKKIVLLRRFNLDDSLKKEHNGTGWGIDGSSWPDNCADGTCGSGDIRVQDFYEVEETKNIEKKITYAVDQLERSGECVCPLPEDMHAAGITSAKQPIFINFLSASNFFSPGCWPDRIAYKVNPSVIEFLCRGHNAGDAQKPVGDGGTGIVVCDWVGNAGDWDLVRCIVGHNAKLEMREKR